MRKTLLSGVAAAAVFALGMGSASATLMLSETSSPNADVPDSGFGVLTDTLNIGQSGSILDIEVELAIAHTWVGDLIIELTSPGGTTITLMDRPGVPATTFGDPSNFAATTPIRFIDGASLSAESAGSACVGLDDVIGVACDTPPEYDPEDPLGSFLSGEIMGDWTLLISDNASGDTGRLASWTIHAEIDAQQLAEPGTLLLLGAGLAGLAGLGRRRRRA